MRKRTIRFWSACVLVLAAGAGRAPADTVTCFDGRTFEGEVLEEGAETVRIRTASGTVSLPRGDVQKIEKKESPFQAVNKQRAALASDDAKGRWELAQFAVKNGLKRDAAALLAEIRSMASPFYTQATRLLASLASADDPKRAVALLDELTEKAADLDARKQAREIKRTLDQKRQQAWDEAALALEKKGYLEAIESLRYAYQLSYPALNPALPVKLGEDEILNKLAEVRGLAEQFARGKAVPEKDPGAKEPAKKSLLCRKCPDSSGWRTCWKCNGSGKEEKIIPPRIGFDKIIPEQRILITCTVCGGGKLARCPECAGTGLDSQVIESSLRWTLKTISDAAWGRPNDLWLRALKDAVGTAQRGKLRVPEEYTPAYPLSKALREILPAVPVDDDFENTSDGRKFAAAWNKAPRQARANLICHYALEVAKSSLPEAGASGKSEKDAAAPAAEKLDLAALRLTAPIVSATELSALPEDWAGKWVWVSALYQGQDATLSAKDRAAFEIKTERIHNLHPFLFLAAAKAAHEKAAKAPDAPPFLSVLASQYPYEEISAKAAALKAGDPMQMFGRLLFRKERDPETSLELWAFDVSLDPEAQKLLALVRKPVTFHFEQTPLQEALSLLALLTNTPIRVGVPKSAEVNVNARATQQPLAFALRDLLKDAGLMWVFDEKGAGVKVVQDAKPDEIAQAERVMRFMK